MWNSDYGPGTVLSTSVNTVSFNPPRLSVRLTLLEILVLVQMRLLSLQEAIEWPMATQLCVCVCGGGGVLIPEPRLPAPSSPPSTFVLNHSAMPLRFAAPLTESWYPKINVTLKNENSKAQHDCAIGAV